MVLLPRKLVGKSPKWQSFYAGPFVIVRLLSTTNDVIQKSQRSKQQVAHVNKLKRCLGETPASWLLESDNGADDDRSIVEDDEATSVEEVRDPDGIEESAEVDDVDTINIPATLDATEEDATPAPRQQRLLRHLADFVTRATANGSTLSALANEFVPPSHILPCRVVRSIHRCVNECCKSRKMYVAAAQRDDRRDHQTSAEDAGHRRRQPPLTHGNVACGSNTADAAPPTVMGRDAVCFLQYVMKQPGQISSSTLRDDVAEKWRRLSPTARNNMV